MVEAGAEVGLVPVVPGEGAQPDPKVTADRAMIRNKAFICGTP
jgi:hypothetical protein